MITIPGFRVLVRPDKVVEKDEVYKAAKAFGFDLLEENQRGMKLEQNAISRGIVVSIGPGCWKEYGDGSPWCAVGDYIGYSQHAGKFETDPFTDEKFILLNDEDVTSIYTPGEQK